MPCLLAGCTSSTQANAPVRVDAMVTWIERVHVEAERSRQAVGDAFERLNALATGKFDKEPASTVYARFVQSTDLAEQQARRFRDVVGPMVASATPVFAERQQSLATIGNERMRQRSELRFSVDKQRYEAISKVAVPTQDQLDAFVKSLRDHAAFLAYDLNGSAIDEIRDEVKLVAQSARDLDHDLESCQSAARAYMDQVAPAAEPAR